MDFEGNIIESTDRVRVLVSELENDDAMVASSYIGFVETNVIDTYVFQEQSTSFDNIDMEIKDINPILDTPTPSQLL